MSKFQVKCLFMPNEEAGGVGCGASGTWSLAAVGMVFVNIWMLDVDWTLPAQAVVSVKQAFTHLGWSLGFLLFQHLAKDLAMFCFVSCTRMPVAVHTAHCVEHVCAPHQHLFVSAPYFSALTQWAAACTWKACKSSKWWKRPPPGAIFLVHRIPKIVSNQQLFPFCAFLPCI